MEENIKKEEDADCTDCCTKKNNKDAKGFLSGLIYGLLPHTGCIAFILFSILGITTATAIFKPLLMSRYFFYGLIILSFVFATISAGIYLKRCNMLSKEGIKKKWKYLSVLYGTSIGINLLLFMIIFPIAANITTASIADTSLIDAGKITLQVNIPCPGHAPLISDELKKINGVNSVVFSFPNNFEVSFDKTKTSQDKILSPDIFQEYPAKITSAQNIESQVKSLDSASQRGCSSCGGCSGSCGSSCGINLNN